MINLYSNFIALYISSPIQLFFYPLLPPSPSLSFTHCTWHWNLNEQIWINGDIFFTKKWESVSMYCCTTLHNTWNPFHNKYICQNINLYDSRKSVELPLHIKCFSRLLHQRVPPLVLGFNTEKNVFCFLANYKNVLLTNKSPFLEQFNMLFPLVKSVFL